MPNINILKAHLNKINALIHKNDIMKKIYIKSNNNVFENYVNEFKIFYILATGVPLNLSPPKQPYSTLSLHYSNFFSFVFVRFVR